MATWQDDLEFEVVRLTKVEVATGGGWSVERDDGWSFFVPAESPVVPHVGSEARFYGRGIGYTVRGLVINGQVAFYRTAEEQERLHREQCEEQARQRREKFEQNRTKLDAAFAVLPEPFQRRIMRFRHARPDFRWEYEPYEMFTCEQAVVIAQAFKTPAQIDAFHELDWKVQKVMVPDLSDGHSGNTFECACYLAKLYLTAPELVAQASGALSPLVGSAAYEVPLGQPPEANG